MYLMGCCVPTASICALSFSLPKSAGQAQDSSIETKVLPPATAASPSGLVLGGRDGWMAISSMQGIGQLKGIEGTSLG